VAAQIDLDAKQGENVEGQNESILQDAKNSIAGTRQALRKTKVKAKDERPHQDRKKLSSTRRDHLKIATNIRRLCIS